MITQNILAEFMANASKTAQVRSNVGVEKSSSAQFEDTFNKTMEKVQYRDKNLYGNNRYQSREERNEGKERFNTYREVERVNNPGLQGEKVKLQKAETDKVSKLDENSKKTDDEKKEVKSRDEITMNVLANILGMDAKDLTSVLESMDIKPEELTKNTSETVNKMAAFFGLDNQQTKALTDIMEMLKSQVDSQMGNNLSGSDNSVDLMLNGSKINSDDKSWIKVDNVKVEDVDKNKAFSEFEEIMAGFKSKLEELTQKFMQNPEKVSDGFAQEIKKILAQFKEQVLKTDTEEQTVAENTSTEEALTEKALTEKADTSAAKVSKESDINKAEKQDNKVEETADLKAPEKQADNTGRDSGVAVQRQVHGTGVKVSQNETAEINNSIIQNQAPKSGETDVNLKVHKEAPVSKNELFNQIIEKAKVLTNGEKSEMVLDLKPDSLGKLSLKIVTEHGIVSAKFVAESQQVKEVLESNMQLLKDSLEKQGLSVQGFSVSVGQQSSNGFRREGEFSNGSKTKTTGGKVETVQQGMISAQNVSVNLERSNPYNWGESRINLTA